MIKLIKFKLFISVKKQRRTPISRPIIDFDLMMKLLGMRMHNMCDAGYWWGVYIYTNDQLLLTKVTKTCCSDYKKSKICLNTAP